MAISECETEMATIASQMADETETVRLEEESYWSQLASMKLNEEQKWERLKTLRRQAAQLRWNEMMRSKAISHLQDTQRRAALREMIDSTPGYFFLYQADNAIFLHPLNYDMLMSEHGSVEALPTSVEAKVIDIERA